MAPKSDIHGTKLTVVESSDLRYANGGAVTVFLEASDNQVSLLFND